MKEQLIAFKTAKLAKEKGFDIETCDFYSEGIISNLIPQGDYKYLSVNYDDIGEDISPYGMWNWNSTNNSKRLITAFNECYGEEYKELYSAPTQSLLQKWLREVHNIDVVLSPERYSNGINYLVQAQKWDLTADPEVNPNFVVKGSFWYNDNHEYPTYEKALEKGLQEALKLI